MAHLTVQQSVKLTPALAERLALAVDAWDDPALAATPSNVLRRAIELGLACLLATSRRQRARAAAAARWSATQRGRGAPARSGTSAARAAPDPPAAPRETTRRPS